MNVTAFHTSQHLSADELYDRSRACPICLRERVGRKIMRVQKAPDVDLLACENCGGCSTSLMPKPDVLSKFYKRYYDSRDEKTTYDDIGRLARHIKRLLGSDFKVSCPRILDFGGGDGSLAIEIGLSLLRESGCTSVEICVVDSPASRPTPNPGITVTSYDSLEKVSGYYDLVIASAVLEHIPEVNPVFLRLVALMRRGGWFYARTPFIAPFARLPVKVDFTFPGHVHDLGPRFWDAVLETFSLDGTIIHSEPSPLETTLSQHFFRTLAAAILKFPARLESCLRSSRFPRRRLWQMVGGWEILFRLNNSHV